MTARQWTLKEPAAIFFIGRSLLNHGHYTHGRNRTIIQTRHLRRCRRRTHRRLASGFIQYRECAASNLDPDDPTIKVRLGFGLPSLCTRGAQTWASVPYSTQDPMPTVTAAFVAARFRQKPNTSRARQAFTHIRILGEYKANVKRLYSAIFCDWKDARREQEGSGRGTRVGTCRP